ncbi:hypothetical protein ACN24L_03540 [Streptomyces microflavus]
MLAAYEADPQLAALRLDFPATLREMLQVLLAGCWRGVTRAAGGSAHDAPGPGAARLVLGRAHRTATRRSRGRRKTSPRPRTLLPASAPTYAARCSPVRVERSATRSAGVPSKTIRPPA